MGSRERGAESGEWGVESGEMGFVMVVGRGEWVSGKGGKTLVASWQMFPNLNQIDIGAGAVGAVGVCEGGLVVAWCWLERPPPRKFFDFFFVQPCCTVIIVLIYANLA